MDTNTLIVVLAIATLLAAVGIGFWQKARTRKAEKNNEHSALSERRPELKANPHGTEPESVRPLAQRVEENR
jgi:Flp pilus assembly protein TadB